MSDPSLEEESLISQDDIDALLDASSIEDAEKQIDASPALDEDPDDLGELSQDDIDSLMGNNDPVEQEGGELSQDDIDSLLSSGPDPDPAEEEEDLELISQDDIDRLMSPSEDRDDTDTQISLDEGDDELISLDDIQGMINEEDSGEEEPEEEPEISPAPIDDLMDEPMDDSEAMAVVDCLITQETMDALMESADSGDTASSLPDPGDVTPFSPDDVDSPDDVEPEIEDLVPTNMGGDEDDFLPDPMGDLDQLLESNDIDLDSEEDSDVSQEDIDALLLDSDEDDDLPDDDDILISQDDIDTLLMAADQEDEDVLGDLMGDDGNFDMEEEFDVGDIMGGERTDDPGINTDQVVLEDAEGENLAQKAPNDSRLSKITGLFKSKLFLAAASVILVLGISIPVAYFFFFSGQEPVLPQSESVPLAEQGVNREIEVANLTIEEDIALPVMRQSGTIVLADFVILASDLSKKMTFVYADISIDYSDQRAYHEINNNLSFYRDLIYGAIQTHLVSEKREEVTKADLIWGVETSLKKVLPPHYIKKISFKTFRTS